MFATMRLFHCSLKMSKLCQHLMESMQLGVQLEHVEQRSLTTIRMSSGRFGAVLVTNKLCIGLVLILLASAIGAVIVVAPPLIVTEDINNN